MKTTLTIILTFIFLQLNAQSEYARFIVADSIGKLCCRETKDGIEKIKYLGVIRKDNGELDYHVITASLTIEGIVGIHGYALVLFLTKDKMEKKRYELSMKEELPFKLKNNTLFFHYTETKSNKKKIYKIRIDTDLPKWLTVNPSNSYFTGSY